MKYNFLFLAAAICILAPNAHAQYCACDPEDSRYNENYNVVTAPSGLILRAGPGRNSAKLASIPFGEEVLVCRSTTVKETIEGIESYWVKVSWAEKSGYLFGGFLKKEEHRKVRLFMPNAGVDSEWHCAEFTPEIHWEALIDTDTLPGKKQAFSTAHLTNITVKPGRKKKPHGCGEEGYFENAPVNITKAPFVVIGGCKLAAKVSNFIKEPIKLLPGEMKVFSFYDHENQVQKIYTIAAEGNVIGNPQFLSDNRIGGPVIRIESYKVMLYEQTNYLPSQNGQNRPVKKQKLHEGTAERMSDTDSYDLTVLNIVFAGDLDGDNELDLILSSGESYNLYLSSKKLPGFLLRYVASWHDSDC